MSFFFRAPSHTLVSRTHGRGATSFSVRTGRMEDSSGPAVSAHLSKAEPSKEFLAAKHFLHNEVKAAYEAVSALDRYIAKLKSFEGKALELLEEAHRALSRVEQAVAISAAPELIIVACEIKVACHRGLHLFRTYGRYRYLGKLVAIATRSSITAKFNAVIARLTSIIPLDQHIPAVAAVARPIGSKALAAAADTGSPGQTVAALHLRDRLDSTGTPDSACSTPRAVERAATSSSSAAQTVAAAAGVLANLIKSGSNYATTYSSSSSNGLSSAPFGTTSAAAAAVASVLVRSGTHDRITAISFVQPFLSLSAAACVWWSVGDKLEFYSSVTQSTTSFAASQTQTAGRITAITLDSAGNVWAGTSKGSVIMRQRKNWEQLFFERAFSSCVRCLAADADSDVVWGGDETGQLAVLRYNEATNKVECTATILPGRPSAGATLGGLKGRSAPVMTAAVQPKPRSLLRLRVSTSCRDHSHKSIAPAEGPIRTMLVRDDRAWVAGGRSEPWLAVFDAVQGTQLDMWVCGSYGSCMAMTSLLTTAALAEQAAATAGGGSPGTGGNLPGTNSSDVMLGSLIASTVHEDGIGEDPRSSWRLVTGHENGQLLIWNAASDVLQPLVKIGEAGSSPIRAVAALEQQALLATAHANGELALFNRPAKDEDWMLQCLAAAPSTPQRITDSAGGSRRPSGSSAVLLQSTSTALAAATVSAAAAAMSNGGPSQGQGSSSGLTTIKPRRALLRTHRCNIAAAAACSYGVVTASSIGAIKLWTADALGQEAERVGLRSHLMPATSDMACVALKSLGGAAPSRLASAAVGDHLGRYGSAAPAVAAAADCTVKHTCSMSADYLGRFGSTAAEHCQQQQQQVLQQQPQRRHSGSPRLSYACTTSEQQQQQQLLQPPSWQQQVPSPPQQLPQQQWHAHSCCAGITDGSPRAMTSMSVPGHTSQPSSGGSSSSYQPQQQERQQLPELSRRSAPLKIPTDQTASHTANAYSASLPNALLQHVIAPHQQPGSTDSTGSIGAATHGGFIAASSVGSRFGGAAGLLAGGFGVPPPVLPEVITAPRAPKALRDDGAAGGVGVASRERRKSERRLSKGAQMQWSSCQMIDSNELKLISSIGSGAYGKVWLAEWMGTQVAVKELLCFQDRAKDEVHKRKGRLAKHPSAEEEDGGSDSDDSIEAEVQRELKELMSEVFLLGSLTHPSISRFCALCLDPPMIVMQYYPHGSMYELLKRGRRGDKRAVQELSWPKRLEMLRDVASGMVFLHSRRPPIVHGDLRSPNLLLDYTVDRDKGRYHVKIADFGLAVMLGPTTSIAVSKVTNPRWSAPEVIRSSTVSRGADVFSFGILMWELLTWQQPYEEMMSVQVLFSLMQQTRPEIPIESQLPGSPGSQLHRYIALMEACWQEDSAARPTFEQVVSALDEMRAVDCIKQGRAGAGSRRVSSMSETGTPVCGTPVHFQTPTGSSFLGNSPESSLPGSAPSSAPNSGGPTAAAAAAAAAMGVNTPTPDMTSAGSSRQATSAGSTRSASPYTACVADVEQAPADSVTSILDPAAAMTACQSADVDGVGGDSCGPLLGPSNTISAWRLAAQSDPGTPVTAGSSSHNGGITPGTLGDQYLQLAGVGSSPASSLNGAASGALGPFMDRAQQQQQQAQPPPPPSVTSSMSGSGTPCGPGSPGSFAAYAEPSFAVQLVGSGLPALGGGGPLMVQVPPPVARTRSRLGPTRSSGTVASPNARDAAVAAIPPGAVLHVHGLPPVNTGCGSSSVVGQASPPAKSSSSFSGAVAAAAAAGPPSPASPHHKGMSAYSPFAAASGPPVAAEVLHTDTAVANQVPAAAAAASVCSSSPHDTSLMKRPVSPFSAVQGQPGTNGEQSPCPSSAGSAVSRPSSPFANVQPGQLPPARQRVAECGQWPPGLSTVDGQHSQHNFQEHRPRTAQQPAPMAANESVAVVETSVAAACFEADTSSPRATSPDHMHPQQQSCAGGRSLLLHRPGQHQHSHSGGSSPDSLGAHSPFGLMQPLGSDSVASPVASPAGSFSVPQPNSAAPAAAAANHLPVQPVHHGPSRLGAISAAAGALAVVQGGQQQPAGLPPRVSPFTAVSAATVEGTVVSQSVLQAKAATLAAP